MAVSEWLDMMNDEVTVYPFTGRSASAKPTYSATGTTYPAYIELMNRLVVDKMGHTVTARGRVFLGTEVVIGTEDKIVIPSEYHPTDPPIISVNVQNDENGNHHTVVYFG